MTWPAPDRPDNTVLPDDRSSWRTDVVTALFVAAVTVLLGAPAGLAWSALAPHLLIDIQAGGATFAGGISEDFVAADGWFLAIGAVLGLVTGALTWLVARRSGPYVVVALAVGGALAALVASKVGMRVGRDELLAAAAGGLSGRYVANVALQAQQVLLAWPIAALASYLILHASRSDS